MKTVFFSLFLCGALCIDSHAQTISLSFAGDNTGGTAINLAGPSDVAGVVPVANWNLDSQGAAGDLFALTDDSGAATTAAVGWIGPNNTWGGTGATTADEMMVNGWLDDNGTGAAIEVIDIPYAGYDLYVYGSSDAGNAGRGLTVNVNGMDFFSGGVFVDPVTDGGSFFTGFVDASTADDNPSYFKITGLSGSSLSILGARNTAGPELPNGSTDYRGSISAFQITAVPEPASFSTVAFAMLSVLALRRRA